MERIWKIGDLVQKTNVESLVSGATDDIHSRFNRLLTIDFYSFRKEWEWIKKGMINDVLERKVEEIFAKIDDRWPSLEQYRLEVAAHAFGTTEDKSVSIFSPEGMPYYQIPLSWHDTVILVMHSFDILNQIAASYRNWFKEFVAKTFPKSEFQEHLKEFGIQIVL